MNRLFLIVVLMMSSCILRSQQTVGTFSNTASADNGYTLFSPNISLSTYLIDNCGYAVNTWEAMVRPALSSYLLDDGSLLRTGFADGPFNAGGKGGLIEIYDWEGQLTWQFEYSTLDYQQHHDVEPMPNGNVLIIAWEHRNEMEAIDNGREPELITLSGIWPDHIIEVDPKLPVDDNIVWEWHAWDHLIQDYDKSKLNFGVIDDHPERIDVNYGRGALADWMHTNSVEYIPERDEILLSVKHFNEIWVIDHSTTTEEARSSIGGRHNMGGDLLYRWGNPAAYNRGTTLDQKFFAQHAARSISSADGLTPQFVVYNNGVSRPKESYSSIDIIQPTLTEEGFYSRPAELQYAPTEVDWTFIADPPRSLFNANQGGVSITPNGNFIISDTRNGSFIEIDEDKEVQWTYVSPVGHRIFEQEQSPTSNGVFRVERYTADFLGLKDKDLTPGERIELNSSFNDCVIHPNLVSTSYVFGDIDDVAIYPTIVTDQITISNISERSLNISILDMSGRSMYSAVHQDQKVAVHVNQWPAGIYITHIIDRDNGALRNTKIIKQ